MNSGGSTRGGRPSAPRGPVEPVDSGGSTRGGRPSAPRDPGTRTGGGWRAQRERLVAEQAAASLPVRSRIFRGLCFHVNGYTGALVSSYKFVKLIRAHGGAIALATSKRKVTHVVATNLSFAKEGAALTKGKMLRFVQPEWVLACVEAGTRVSEVPYEVVRDRRFAPLPFSRIARN